MFLLLAAISAAASPPPHKAVACARASITILRPYQASRTSWNPASRSNQREIVRKEPGGAEVRLRLTEFE